jgi:hypothetical protein
MSSPAHCQGRTQQDEGHLQAKKMAYIRNQMNQDLGLGLLRLQNCEK